MKRVLLEPVFILHRYAYRETSLLIDVFSQEYGRLSLIAKGIRKKNNRLVGMLQPFVPLYASFSGKEDLFFLNEADIREKIISITGNALIAGLYLNELLVNLLQKSDPHPALFQLYENTLTALQADSLDEKIIRSFEKKLLDELGYGLFPKTQDAIASTFERNTFYRFQSVNGWIKNENGNSQQEFSYSGEMLFAIANEEWDDEVVMKYAKRLMRQVLTELMNAKTVYSRQMFVK